MTPRKAVTPLIVSVLLVLLPALCRGDGPAPASVEQLARLIKHAFPEDGSGGVVLVARGEEVLHEQAFGKAHIELAVPMQTGSVLAIGSLAKSFTAAAVLLLVRDGVLFLDDDIQDYVPELPTQGRAVTVRQLLAHTSGLPNLVDLPQFDELLRHPLDPGESLALIKDLPWHFEPGRGFRYSDSGYIALGLLIERVGGMSYDEFLRRRVFEPLGMRRTHYGHNATIIPGRVTGYSRADEGLVNATVVDMSVPYSAGALISTAEDLHRWYLGWRNGRLLGTDLTELALTARGVPDGGSRGYGFGWALCDVDGAPTVEHGGFIPGFRAYWLWLRGSDVLIVVLVNTDTGPPEPSYLARRIARLMLTGSPELVPYPDTDKDTQARLLGDYQFPSGRRARIFLEDGELYWQQEGRDPSRLIAAGTDLFYFADSEGTYGFRLTTDAETGSTVANFELACEPAGRAVRIREKGQASSAAQ